MMNIHFQKNSEEAVHAKYLEPDIDSFAKAFAFDMTSVCEPINDSTVETLRGQLKSEGDILSRFDLGYIPKKYHMIFLYFLRLNPSIQALHARDVCLKADVVRQVL